MEEYGETSSVEVAGAINLLQSRYNIDSKPTEDKWWVDWCKHLNVRIPHPLQGNKDTVQSVKDIYEFCKQTNEKDPELELRNILSRMPNIFASDDRVGAITKYIRLKRSYDVTKRLLDSQEASLRSMIQQ